jgi:Tol biopolymer transport system component
MRVALPQDNMTIPYEVMMEYATSLLFYLAILKKEDTTMKQSLYTCRALIPSTIFVLLLLLAPSYFWSAAHPLTVSAQLTTIETTPSLTGTATEHNSQLSLQREGDSRLFLPLILNAGTGEPTDTPVVQPTDTPVVQPTDTPVVQPTDTPVVQPTDTPVVQPTDTPVVQPTDTPVVQPTDTPVVQPTDTPVVQPTDTPVVQPTDTPVVQPTDTPVVQPTDTPVPMMNKIVFSYYDGNDFEIYIMDSDGKNPVQLTDNDFVDFTPSWSPDGSKIAFSSDRDGDREIFVMNRDGSNQQQITDTYWVSNSSPTWSPDGSKIAFHRISDVTEYYRREEIYTINLDGTEETLITEGGQPDWSPDGTKLAYVRGYETYNSHLYTINIDGTNEQVFYLSKDVEQTPLYPDWSPDGSKLIFARSAWNIHCLDLLNGLEIDIASNAHSPSWLPDGRYIYVTDRYGADRIVVRSESYETILGPEGLAGGTIQSPEWKATNDSPVPPTSTPVVSPTNTPTPVKESIVFAYKDGTDSEIYIMESDGSNPTQLTDNDFDDYAPSWSPDGSKIAFISNRNGNFRTEVFIMNRDGSNQQQITFNSTEVQDYDPEWSPDGSKIVFYRYTGEVFDYQYYGIYTINPDGSGETFVIEGRDPGWSPDGTKLVYIHFDHFLNIINADGTNKQIIYNADDYSAYNVHVYEPRWSPDGSRFLFQEGSFIYSYQVSINKETLLAFGHSPSWTPDGRYIYVGDSGYDDVDRIFVGSTMLGPQGLEGGKIGDPGWVRVSD